MASKPPEAIGNFLRELIRQANWLDMAVDRDQDALDAMEGIPLDKWKKVESGDAGPFLINKQSTSRIWTRQDFRRFDLQRAYEDADDPSEVAEPRRYPQTRAYRIYRRMQPRLIELRAAALAEAHANYPAIAPRIAAAAKIHEEFMGAFVNEDWNHLRDCKPKRERAIERVNELLPTPIPDDDLYFHGFLARKKATRRSQCPHCGEFNSTVENTTPKGGNVKTQYLKCHSCGENWNRLAPKR